MWETGTDMSNKWSVAALWIVLLGVDAAPVPAAPDLAEDRCESLLRECEARSQETLSSRRAGLWDALRELERACVLSETDPRVAAKAAFLYLSLPEYSSLESELKVLAEVEAKLLGVEGGEDVLAATLDWKAGALEGLGREEEALAAFGAALQIRQERFGRGSAEEAKALLHLGQHYSQRAETTKSPSDLQHALEYGESAVRSLWQANGEKDSETKEMLMQFEALLKSLGMKEADVERLTERYRHPAQME